MTDNSDPIPLVTHNDAAAISGSLVAENVEALKALFPTIVADSRVDFDALRQLLGDVVEDSAERYGLTWRGKAKARAFALSPSLGTLRPAEGDSTNWNTTRNIVVEGDNLEVLKILRKSYSGQAKFIYIDPPYNTGGDFVYPDNYRNTIENYQVLTGQKDGDGAYTTTDREAQGRLHTDWLNMIYPRLFLAKEFLKDDGVIAISIDDREYSNLFAVCSEIFGVENFVGNIVWKNATDNNPTNIAVEHEYILLFCKNKSSIPSEWKSGASDIKNLLVKKGSELIAEHSGDELEEAYKVWFREHRMELWPLDRYKYIDAGGVYTGSQSVHNPGKEGYRYDVIHPDTKKPCKQPLMGYRFPKSTMDDLIAADRILFGDDETKIIELKVYAKDYKEKLPSWVDVDGRLGAYDLKEDFPEAARAFSNPKPVSLIEKIASFIATDEDDLIIDFFAGSGTTARAVWELNKSSGNRRFLLVQYPEPLSPLKKEQKAASDFCDKLGKPRNIAELTKERLRRAGKKLSATKNIDTGFRVFKLDASGLRPWQPDPTNLEASLLDSVDNILLGRSEDDLLVELLLKTGIDLTLSSESREIAGHTVHALGGGTMMACLANIPEADAEPLGHGIVEWRAELDPPTATTFYFKDSGFETACAKANLAAILRQRLDRTAIAKLASI
jgi:adenine-specific DNA-methyltransferase